jgi:chitinase
MRANGFQGIDIDWEFPAAEDRANFPALLHEVRRQLDSLGSPERSLLTIAAGASPYQIEDLILSGEKSILPPLDWINLMAYSYHGPWSQRTNFNAPLYASPSDPAESEIERLTFNVHAAVQAYLSAGVPGEKIVVGVPFFGRGWQGVPAGNGGLYQAPGEPAPGTWGGEGGSYDYKDLAENYLGNADCTLYWHEQALVPWLYNATESIFISYDNPRSLAIKAAYARENGLGGIMIWQLAADDAQATLLSSLFDSLFSGP